MVGDRSQPWLGLRNRVGFVVLLAITLSILPAAGGQVQVLASPTTLTERVDLEVPDPDDLEGVAAEGLAAARSASGAVRTAALETPLTFSMVGFELPEGVDQLRVRTSEDGREWSDWVLVERVDAADGPDAGTAEDGATARRYTDPVWAEEANHLQVALAEADAAAVGQVSAELIDTVGHNDQAVERRVVRSQGESADAAERPQVVSRAQWGANESWAGSPSYASSGVHMGVVHHTATSNSYSDAKAVMRSMYHYHTQSLGWKDLGYNIVIDREGNVYEGRKGGLERGVIGAHARGYNTGSFGVSVIGNHNDANPTQATLRALENVIAWQASTYGIDPQGSTSRMSGGTRPTIVGHQDVGQTSCPGRIQNHLPDLRRGSAAKAVDFPDVAGTHRDSVLALAEAGVINGCGNGLYCPGKGLTRAQMASLLSRALGLEEQSKKQRFSDVPTHHPHREGIHALVDAGVVSGYPDGTFRPEADLQRDQMATYLANGFDYRRRIYRARFSDVPPTSTHAGAVEAAAREDVTRGCNADGTRYCPGDTLRRDQAASLLHRALRRADAADDRDGSDEPEPPKPDPEENDSGEDESGDDGSRDGDGDSLWDWFADS